MPLWHKHCTGNHAHKAVVILICETSEFIWTDLWPPKKTVTVIDTLNLVLVWCRNTGHKMSFASCLLVAERYRIQCDSFAYMWHLIQELVTRLASRFKMGSSSDFRIYYDSPLPLQEYFEIIDQHFEVWTICICTGTCIYLGAFYCRISHLNSLVYYEHVFFC